MILPKKREIGPEAPCRYPHSGFIIVRSGRYQATTSHRPRRTWACTEESDQDKTNFYLDVLQRRFCRRSTPLNHQATAALAAQPLFVSQATYWTRVEGPDLREIS